MEPGDVTAEELDGKHVERIEFPGIVELYGQFVDEYTRLRTHQRNKDE